MSWPVSAAFKAALKLSHTPTMKVEILEDGALVAQTEVVVDQQRLTVLDGNVSDDRKAQVGRRSVDITLVDPQGAFVPLTTTHVVYPLRDLDLRLWRGVEGVHAGVSATDPAMVPMATVQLEAARVVDDDSDRVWSLSGTDRSKSLANADWRDELVVASGTTPRAATLAILARVDPGHTYTVIDSPTAKVLDELVFLPGEAPNPWEAIVKVWEAAAMEVFFDQLGQLKAQPIPNPLTAPLAWSFLDDTDSIRVAPLNVDVDRATLRNGVVVRGTAPWLLYGVFGQAWDTDPGSTTYFDPANAGASVVGPHPEYIDDSLVSTTAEANALATAKLPDLLGIEERVEFNLIPNPALEAGDVVVLSTPMVKSGRFILDALVTPLTFEGTQAANTRRRTR